LNVRSLLHQLENNEGVLLMYLAGELPQQDRADVEQMLVDDPGLRTELERLRETVAQVESALAELDRAERLPVSADVAARRVGRMVSQWNADRLAADAAAAAARAARPHRVSKWAYPAAAVAACALISAGIWWASNSGVRGVLGPVATTNETPAIDDLSLPVAVADEDPAEDPADDAVAGGAGGRGQAWRDRLDALEEELYALSSTEGSFDGVETR
jgi:hypothetical protein